VLAVPGSIPSTSMWADILCADADACPSIAAGEI
jgi:hypothetical protein